jgi:SAM-dependent methyltransferase
MDNDFSEIYRRYFLDYENLDAFLFHAQEELTCISLEGKKVLEIGCGRGAFSLYMALSGKAKKVIALDEAEGHGSDEKGFHQLKEIVQKNSISNVETIKSGIKKVKIQENTLDLIVANFSIHHVLRPSGYIFKDKKAKEDLLNIFNCFRWKMSHIDWEIHPTLKEWLWVLKTAGFEELSYTFLTPYFLSAWPSMVVRNRLANFFFSSTFYLHGKNSI